VVGGLLGNAMLGVAALIGADARVPAMVLQRAPLGQRGSYLATGLNVLQCLGWSVFEITIIAFAAGALSQRLVGFHVVWLWKLCFGALGLVLALIGPVGFVRRFVRKIGIWAVAASIVYLAVWIVRHGELDHLWHAHGSGGSFWLGRRPRDRTDGLVGAARRRITRASRAAPVRRSSAPGSGTCCRRSSSSASARCWSSRIRRSVGRRTS